MIKELYSGGNLYEKEMIKMNKVDEVINQIISSFQEKQGSSKKLLRVDDFEKVVMDTIGSPRQYNELGGYKKFQENILLLLQTGILQNVTKAIPNGKRPSLNSAYWIVPKYVENFWEKADIAKVLTYLDISFYLRNKKHQTEEEWRRIQTIYDFLRNKESHIHLNREERSFMLFKNQHLPDGIEPEKFLSSSHGKLLLSRIKLTEDDLLFKVVREPLHYWRNDGALEEQQTANEVLVIEGLSTYYTLREMLMRNLPWNFGPIPHYLIWGEGYRISSTLDYLQDITANPNELTIRYTGDIDYEGFNIYLELKSRYKELNISLAHPFYKFLITFSEELATDIVTNQRIVDKNLYLLHQEFKDNEEIYQGIEKLWITRKRIPQECINFENIIKKEG